MTKQSIAEQFGLKSIKRSNVSLSRAAEGERMRDAKYKANANPDSVAKHYIQYRINSGWTYPQIARASKFELPFGKTKWSKQLLVDACVEWLTK